MSDVLVKCSCGWEGAPNTWKGHFISSARGVHTIVAPPSATPSFTVEQVMALKTLADEIVDCGGIDDWLIQGVLAIQDSAEAHRKAKK